MTADALLEAMHRLVVTSDGPGVLLVDATDLVDGVHQPRYWRLHEQPGGRWFHSGSGESAPLVEVLHSIALVYVGAGR